MRYVGQSRASNESGNIETVDGYPTPAVVVDTDGQLHAETGIIADANDTKGDTAMGGIIGSRHLPG